MTGSLHPVCNYLVCGASSGIGLALFYEACVSPESRKVVATHRDSSDLTALLKIKEEFPEKVILQPLQAEQESDYLALRNLIATWNEPLDVCINAIGVLHDEKQNLFPERKLEEVTLQGLMTTLTTNVAPSFLLAKHLKPFFKVSERPVFAAISAKVGSLDDNHTGGWHSYRTSKAALNMAIKNIAIEFSRLNKQSCVLALHPGTTETKLAEPFLASARKKYQVHSAQETACNLMKVIADCQRQGITGGFYSWDGTTIPW